MTLDQLLSDPAFLIFAPVGFIVVVIIIVLCGGGDIEL
jgi:hypothetical protein